MLIRPQGKLGDGIAVMDTEWHRTVQAQGGTIVALRGKKHGPLLLLDPVRGPRIVKARRAEHAKAELAAHRFDAAYQVVSLFYLFHRHEVRDLCHPLSGEEARQEDVRIRQIAVSERLYKLGRNLKPPAFGVVQEGGENGRRVKVRAKKSIEPSIPTKATV